MKKYIESTYYFDYESNEIQELIKEYKTNALTDKEKAQRLYLKIRDGWMYYPYYISFSKENYKSSYVAKKSKGQCIEKSILLISCLRGLGIPARIHLAKVKNHIAVKKLTEMFGTNELTPHAMVNIFLDEKWLKASPAFNKQLCEKSNVAVLDFDGENDSVFQEFDNSGNTFMEYIEDYGHFEDVPTDFIFSNILQHYPMIQEKYKGVTEIQF